MHRLELPRSHWYPSCWLCGKKDRFIPLKANNFMNFHFWCWFKLLFTKYKGDVVYYVMDNSD